ncbi:hypothetical protein MPNT_50138 [Candidatus Methylacidithermus pantelleriae]|uniref:Uncharacterized protein n=2 Tax=Candidatus Methylacidithermus pantelleriae TaxID=2744239 RepID=A0A8J2BNW5_9BACT|nr:hypothetical protein MPNT_50138 [Candidatus Methylacidithermus pantelleriae]
MKPKNGFAKEDLVFGAKRKAMQEAPGRGRVKKRLLIVVTANPATSGRPAEALRVAAGLAAEEKLSVSVALEGPAQACLEPPRGCWQDEELLLRSLEILKEWGVPVETQKVDREEFDLVVVFGETSLSPQPLLFAS